VSRKKTLWLLIGLQVVFVVCILVWVLMAGAAMMGLNSPEVFQNTTTQLILAYLISYPVSLIVAFVGGWIFFALKRHRAALWCNAYPALWVLSVPMLFLSV